MPNRFAIDKNIATEDGRFHYRDWGGKGWPLLFLHDVGQTSHMWDLVAPLVVEDFRVLALDLRGHGKNDNMGEDYSYPTLADDLRGICETLAIQHPIIVGAGWGASIGLWLAHELPDLPGGLVMVNGGIIELKSLPKEELEKRFSAPNEEDLTVELFREKLIESSPQGILSPAVEAALLAPYVINEEGRMFPHLPAGDWKAIVRQMYLTAPVDLYESVTCPVLIVSICKDNDQEGYSTTVENALSRAEEQIEDVVISRVDTCATFPTLEQPHLIAEALSDFLRTRV